MMGKAGILACVGLAVLAAGCDLTTDRRYVNEGAGVDLYTADRANQVELLNKYIDFICDQVGPDCAVNSPTFVQAGMNDIDQRCDGFLTWLDARRRDKEPILAELSAITTAVHSIMTVTGSSSKSLDIVTAAFGLATATYNNLNSRLLISVNQSTVQEVVYTSQGKYRAQIKAWPVPDKPTAIYLLRNYLRLCTPITIEAAINTTTTLVQRDAPPASMQSLVVANVTPSTRRPPPAFSSQFGPDKITEILSAWLVRPDGSRNDEHFGVLQKFLDKEQPDLRPFAFLDGGKFAALRLKFARQQKLIP